MRDWREGMSDNAASMHSSAFDVEEFLCKYGLSEYAAKFVEEGFDSMEVLKAMSDEDMAHCGVKRGHILKIRLAVEGGAQVLHATEPGQRALLDGSTVVVLRRDPLQKSHRVVQVMSSGEEKIVPMDQLFVLPADQQMPPQEPPPQQPPPPPKEATQPATAMRVKNTFIECSEEDDGDEQPDFRRIASTPPSFSAQGERACLGFVPLEAHQEVACPPGLGHPVKVPMPPMQDLRGMGQPPGQFVAPPFPMPFPVGPQQLPQMPYQAMPGMMPGGILGAHAELFDSRRPSLPLAMDSGVSVKNTFINVEDDDDDDDDEQPSYRPAASSPPAVRMSLQPDDPAPVQPRAAVLPQAAAPTNSAGSALHAEGNCRPCAHSWKPGGCSKGAGCIFCHLCTEEDFKSKRRAKLARLKADKARQKQDGTPDEECDDIVD